jgi:hypothetical protein
VLRSRDRAGAEQESWALLAVYQALRMAMTAATGTVPGTDPDRASFTAALETAREQVTSARGIAIPAGPGDTGRIGRAVLAGLLPARRARCGARKVKCSTSRFHLRDQDRPELPTVITRVLVTIFAPPPDRPAALPRGRSDQSPGPRQPRPETRRDRVTRIMASQPGRDWAGHDLAAMLGIKPATCSPSSPNGPAGASSSRQGKAGTPSPDRYPHRSQPRQARNPSKIVCYLTPSDRANDAALAPRALRTPRPRAPHAEPVSDQEQGAESGADGRRAWRRAELLGDRGR